MKKRWKGSVSYRNIQLEKIAKTTQFSFTAKDEFGLINLLKDFRLFEKGVEKRVVNILRDKTHLYESDFQIFDYHYSIPNDEYAQHFSQTVFFAQSKKLVLPSFSIRSDRFFNRINNYLGIEDIKSEAFPPFVEPYWRTGEKEQEIKESMSAEMLQFFTTEQNWNVEGLNYFMIFYKKNKILPTTEILDFYKKGRDIMVMLSKPQKNKS